MCVYIYIYIYLYLLLLLLLLLLSKAKRGNRVAGIGICASSAPLTKLGIRGGKP